jgi:ribose transport system ATP-binding protein
MAGGSDPGRAPAAWVGVGSSPVVRMSRAGPGDGAGASGAARAPGGGPDGAAGVAPVLEMRAIAKTFGPVRALSGVTFSAWAGEVHALMGENGAGKSTLMKILSGVHQADAGGVIRLCGQAVGIADPAAARALGIVTIHQELALSPNLSVAENVFLGREPRRFGLVDRAAMRARCAPVLERLGVGFGPQACVASLSIAERQLVEIARALAAEARVLVMDEPTTSLSARETDRLFALVRRLRAEGMAIIYISHRMAEIDELADRVSVLRDGASVGTLTRAGLTPEALIRMMVGRDLSSFYTKAHAEPARVGQAAGGGQEAGGGEAAPAGQAVLAVEDVADGVRVHGCSFVLARGEVLGIAGLVGAGRTELARLVCGIDRRRGGAVRIEGRALSGRSPAEAIEAGLVYLTEDRKALGLYLDMSVRQNIAIDVAGRDARAGVLDLAAARRRSAAAIRRLAVRTAGDAINVGALSGGNQQKVLLARLLETGPRVLVLDEPTRGVDVGAKSEIYRLIDELAQSGIGVVVISSEMAEIIGVCDRTLVMREGRMVGEIANRGGRRITQEAIMALVAGVAA